MYVAWTETRQFVKRAPMLAPFITKGTEHTEAEPEEDEERHDGGLLVLDRRALVLEFGLYTGLLHEEILHLAHAQAGNA